MQLQDLQFLNQKRNNLLENASFRSNGEEGNKDDFLENNRHTHSSKSQRQINVTHDSLNQGYEIYEKSQKNSERSKKSGGHGNGDQDGRRNERSDINEELKQDARRESSSREEHKQGLATRAQD